MKIISATASEFLAAQEAFLTSNTTISSDS